MYDLSSVWLAAKVSKWTNEGLTQEHYRCTQCVDELTTRIPAIVREYNATESREYATEIELNVILATLDSLQSELDDKRELLNVARANLATVYAEMNARYERTHNSICVRHSRDWRPDHTPGVDSRNDWTWRQVAERPTMIEKEVTPL